MSDRFVWTRKAREAARLLGEEYKTPKEVCWELGISPGVLSKWRNNPIFATHLTTIKEEVEQVVLSRGIANRVRRIEAQVDRWNRLQTVIDERANDVTLANEPGGKTGLMVRTHKMSGPYTIEEYAVDTGLLKEMRELEKLVGQEVGDLDSRSTTDIRTVIINLAAQEGLTPEETELALRESMRMLGPS